MNHSERTQSLILVVDDEQTVLDEVTTVLSAAGFACQCHTTIEAAMVAAETILPDLVLADVAIQGDSGVEMCQRLRRNPMLADVPFMFLSPSQIPDIIRRSDGNRGTYYLRKPFDPGVLVELLDKALAKGRMLTVGSKP